ncbi:hypothetical protein B0T16DRAFT_99216 [Cercophora newfieldiana]|uniref:Uncharacterized protein n=1 Tax=Cercophora newfieldiana TaxID=92897 RepID=A0AA39YGM3_9PEZI|nr:hypothetical protein B0T16DRAFT_99216 [Cercophora newfieldiana]
MAGDHCGIIPNPFPRNAFLSDEPGASRCTHLANPSRIVTLVVGFLPPPPLPRAALFFPIPAPKKGFIPGLHKQGVQSAILRRRCATAALQSSAWTVEMTHLPFWRRINPDPNSFTIRECTDRQRTNAWLWEEFSHATVTMRRSRPSPPHRQRAVVRTSSEASRRAAVRQRHYSVLSTGDQLQLWLSTGCRIEARGVGAFGGVKSGTCSQQSSLSVRWGWGRT